MWSNQVFLLIVFIRWRIKLVKTKQIIYINVFISLKNSIKKHDCREKKLQLTLQMFHVYCLLPDSLIHLRNNLNQLCICVAAIHYYLLYVYKLGSFFSCMLQRIIRVFKIQKKITTLKSFCFVLKNKFQKKVEKAEMQNILSMLVNKFKKKLKCFL